MINAGSAGRRDVSQQSALLTWLQHSSACFHLAEVTAPISMGCSPHASMCCANHFGDEKNAVSETGMSDSCSAVLLAALCVLSWGPQQQTRKGGCFLLPPFLRKAALPF